MMMMKKKEEMIKKKVIAISKKEVQKGLKMNYFYLLPYFFMYGEN